MLENNKELTLLDLQKCGSVAEIVQGMNRCSFGARMLGEVTAKLSQWITNQNPPIAIYDGKLYSPLGGLLQEMVKRNWLAQIVSQQEYLSTSIISETTIIIGAYTENFEEVLSERAKEVIFINQFGMALPGQISDGYFPKVISKKEITN